MRCQLFGTSNFYSTSIFDFLCLRQGPERSARPVDLLADRLLGWLLPAPLRRGVRQGLHRLGPTDGNCQCPGNTSIFTLHIKTINLNEKHTFLATEVSLFSTSFIHIPSFYLTYPSVPSHLHHGSAPPPVTSEFLN